MKLKKKKQDFSQREPITYRVETVMRTFLYRSRMDINGVSDAIFKIYPNEYLFNEDMGAYFKINTTF